jgi:HK97 gp10 family phage protein
VSGIRGIPQAKAALEKVKLEIEFAAPKATQAGGEIVAKAMASRAPRRTGRLASSIRVLEVASFGEGAVARVGSDVPYARFVEFGTVNMAAQPFEEDAADSTSSAVVAAMAAVFKAAIT